MNRREALQAALGLAGTAGISGEVVAANPRDTYLCEFYVPLKSCDGEMVAAKKKIPLACRPVTGMKIFDDTVGSFGIDGTIFRTNGQYFECYTTRSHGTGTTATKSEIVRELARAGWAPAWEGAW